MANIPLQVASRTLDTGSPVSYPQGGEIGRAMQQAGGTLQDVAISIQRKQEQRDAFQADREREGLDAAASNLIQDSVTNAPADGAGLHDTVIGQINPETGQVIRPGAFDKLAADVLKRVPASQRAQFEAELPAMRLRISGKVAGAQNAIEQDYYKVEISKIQGDLLNQIVAADPSDRVSLDQFKQRGLDAIAKSPLQPLAKLEATQLWEQSAAETTYQAWLAKDPEAPAKAAGALGFGHAIAEGIPKQGAALLDTIASTESAGSYNVINGGEHFSSYADHPKKGQRGSAGIAAGRYQFLPSTWERAKAALGLPDFSPASQDKAAWWLAQQDYRSNTGRDLATDLQSPDANVQAGIRRALSSTWEGLKNIGDGQFAGKIAKGPTSTGPDPRFAAIPADKRVAFMRQANSQQEQNVAQYTSGLTDYIAALRDGHGSDRAGQYSPDALLSNLPPDKATAAQNMIDQAKAYGSDKTALAFAAPDEVKSILTTRAAAQDTPGGFRQAASDLSGLQTVLKARNEALLSDPALYVAQQPSISAAFKGMANNPQDTAAARVYATATLAEQNRLGVPAAAQRILPASVVSDYVARFNDQSGGSQNAATLMRSLEAQWGQNWPQVFGELAASKQLPGTALVVGAMNRPDQARDAEALAAAAKIGTTDLEKTVTSDTKKTVSDAVDTALADFNNTLVNNGASGVATFNTFREATYQLALFYARHEDPSEAASRAYAGVLGRKYTFQDSYRVPVEYDAGKVGSGAETILDNLSADGLRLPMSSMNDTATKAAYLRQLQAHGFWITNKDESGLTLMDEAGGAVVTKDGQPLSFTWGDLLSDRTKAGPVGPVNGQLEPGNIDLASRPVVNNPDGTISTVRSMSFEQDGKEILVPTVSPDGKILSDEDAIKLYQQTGKHLGKFKTPQDATDFAERLHDIQGRFYNQHPNLTPGVVMPWQTTPGNVGPSAPVGDWNMP